MSSQDSCSLCAGRGCVTRLFGKQSSSSVPLPNQMMVILYGLPLVSILIGSILGSLMGEVESIIGAGFGLILSFVLLRGVDFVIAKGGFS
jgi:hypothetical protein